jgi:hypothetical protein
VGNAVLKADSRATRISTEHEYSTRRIDLAVAAVMACDRAFWHARRPASDLRLRPSTVREASMKIVMRIRYVDVSLELFLLVHGCRQGALVTIRWLWAETTAEPPQSAVTMLLFPPFTSAVLSLIALTVLKFPVAEASLPKAAKTMFPVPLAAAVLSLIALTVLKFPVAEASLPKAAKTMFPVPLASAVLLFSATARLRPFVVAVLLPNCTSVLPPAETARPPVVVCCVELAPVDGVANAVGAPTQSATMGAPAHTVTNLTDVLMGVSLL